MATDPKKKKKKAAPKTKADKFLERQNPAVKARKKIIPTKGRTKLA